MKYQKEIPKRLWPVCYKYAYTFDISYTDFRSPTYLPSFLDNFIHFQPIPFHKSKTRLRSKNIYKLYCSRSKPAISWKICIAGDAMMNKNCDLHSGKKAIYVWSLGRRRTSRLALI